MANTILHTDLSNEGSQCVISGGPEGTRTCYLLTTKGQCMAALFAHGLISHTEFFDRYIIRRRRTVITPEQVVSRQNGFSNTDIDNLVNPVSP